MYYLTGEMKHTTYHFRFSTREACAVAIESLWALGAVDIWLSKDGKVYTSLLDCPIW